MVTTGIAGHAVAADIVAHPAVEGGIGQTRPLQDGACGGALRVGGRGEVGLDAADLLFGQAQHAVADGLELRLDVLGDVLHAALVDQDLDARLNLLSRRP
jgi:hypothetical protein